MSTPGPSTAPRRTSLVAPVTLTVVGVALLLVAGVVTVFVVRIFMGLLPLDVLDARGEPGPAVLAVVDAPGTATVVLDAATRYAVYLVVPDDAEQDGLDGRLAVTAPDGSPVAVRDSADVSVSASRGDVTASTVAGFASDGAGTYTVDVPPASVDGARVLVVKDDSAVSFIFGVFGGIAGVLVICVLGVLGLGMTVGGGVWWGLRVRARRALRLPPAGPPPGHLPGYPPA
ncbi:hypothetical protein [Cellulomonas sp. URHB0016]